MGEGDDGQEACPEQTGSQCASQEDHNIGKSTTEKEVIAESALEALHARFHSEMTPPEASEFVIELKDALSGSVFRGRIREGAKKLLRKAEKRAQVTPAVEADAEVKSPTSPQVQPVPDYATL